MTAEVDRLLASFRRSRSEEDFRALYRLAAPRLYQLALRLAAWRRAEADDIAQETWLRACRALDGFRGASSFGTWLGGIAVNVRRERLRRPRAVEEADPADLDLRAGADGRDAGSVVDLERAVARLPERARQVLVLHEVEGWTHAEIAAAFDIVEGTSKRQLHDARNLLRTLLTDSDRATGESHEAD